MEPIVLSRGQNQPTLADVFPNCLAAMRGETGSLGLPKVRGAVVVLVDGLGEALLRTRGGHARHIVRGWQPEEVAVSFPSTTVAGITSLTTASAAGEHGLVGYSIWDRAAGEYRNQISGWGSGMDPATWQQRSTVFETITATDASITPMIVSIDDYRDSGLTAASLRGAFYYAAETMEERAELAAALCRTVDRPLVYLYHAELDQAGHKLGSESSEWLSQLEELDHSVATLLDRLPEDIGVIVTADHGMIDIPATEQIDLDGELLEGVVAVAGEPRLRHIYVDESLTAEQFAQLVERYRAREAERAWVFTKDELIASGLYGQHVTPASAQRLGDLVVAARSGVTYYTPDMPANYRKMVGQHGSLTNEETVVPLIRHGAFRQ